MSWLPSFVSLPLAIAGLACAAGPLIIHLLNRRRFRTVEWAAMEYLLQAMQRNRKILRLRDLLLLLLRTAAVLLIGLGLAQPFFTMDRSAKFDGRQPLHAVLLVDNSLSMGRQSLEGSLLDAAKRRGVEFIRRLPAGSRVSVAPLCGSREGLSLDAFQSLDHAEEALERIELSGRAATATTALNTARQAWELEPQLAKRLVLLTDMQSVNWEGAPTWDADKPLQVAAVGVELPDNSWVENVSLQDNLADVETPATVVGVIRHHSEKPRENLQVTLTVDDQVAGVQTIDMPAGSSSREVSFQHLFNQVRPEPGRPLATLLEISIPEDRLPEDDRRRHVGYVVASLPVVFVDTEGDQENVARGRIGGTRHLRTLLAPADDATSLIKIRHIRPDQLDRDQLADARLTVVSGVPRPGPWTDLLLDYVQQGGQLLLTAGGEFDSVAWTEATWQNGRHLLPFPLRPALTGALPSANAELNPFFLDFDSVRSHDLFRIAGVAEEDLRDLYAEPMFFQTVTLDEQSTTTDDGDPSVPNDATAEAEQTTARWVAWPPRLTESSERFGTPQVLARFAGNGLPFLVERHVGEGRVVFASTGMLSEWSTLPRTNAILIMDRILRSLIDSTMAPRNFAAQDRIALPLPSSDRGTRWELERPGSSMVESLEPGFIGSELRGLTIDRPLRNGTYRLRAIGEAGDVRGNVPLAVEAPPSESVLTAAPIGKLREQLGEQVHFLEHDEPISLSGAQTSGHDLWWWLVAVGLGLLLLELLVLMPWRSREAGSASSGTIARSRPEAA
ncbi:MAG: BatA domain-containing protein [Planctomycetales bacterium]|nr:BatA domain-containing protein [Planctomycetales bacterium]